MFFCLGCSKTFKNTKALHTHAASCTKKSGHGSGVTLMETLRKRLAEESMERRAKQQKKTDKAAEQEQEKAQAVWVSAYMHIPGPVANIVEGHGAFTTTFTTPIA